MLSGSGHQTAGEIGIAFVVPREGASVTEAELLDFLRPILASHKRPQRVMLMGKLPLTAGTGKVQKFRLKELALQMMR